MFNFNHKIFSSQKLTEIYVIVVTAALLIWHFLIYTSPHIDSPRYLNIGFFALITCLTMLRPQLGLFCGIFSLPFLTGFFIHFESWTGTQVQQLDIWSLDICIGIILGLFIRHLYKKRSSEKRLPNEQLPIQWVWSTCGIHIFLVASALVSISRNLNQTSTSWTTKGFMFNFLQVRTLNWHDDFFPLQDLFVFMAASLLALYLIRFFREHKLTDPFWPPSALLYANFIIIGYGLLQKIFRIGFLQASERGVNSFFPDIHSFSGFELFITAICLSGSILKSKPRWLFLTGFAFALLGVFMSGSRFGIVSAPVLCLTILLILYKNINKRTLFNTVLAVFCTSLIAGTWFLQSKSGNEIIKSFSKESILEADFNSVNRLLSLRPEQWLAALKMHKQYPVFGIGLADFNRSSSIEGFSTSKYLLHRRGENAHNYFIQILVEIGWVGVMIFLSPLFFMRIAGLNLRLAIVFILGISSGNIFGHELLLREFVIILILILATTFALGESRNIYLPAHKKYPKLYKAGFVCLVVLILGATATEIYRSFHKIPFKYASLCYQAGTQKFHDGWTPIRFLYEDPTPHKHRAFVVYTQHPNVHINPLTIRYGTVNGTDDAPMGEIVVSDHGKHVIRIKNITPSKKSIYFLNANRCFVPLSWGISHDRRRLAMNVQDIKNLESSN